jgi:hypothetical protein
MSSSGHWAFELVSGPLHLFTALPLVYALNCMFFLWHLFALMQPLLPLQDGPLLPCCQLQLAGEKDSPVGLVAEHALRHHSVYVAAFAVKREGGGGAGGGGEAGWACAMSWKILAMTTPDVLHFV